MNKRIPVPDAPSRGTPALTAESGRFESLGDGESVERTAGEKQSTTALSRERYPYSTDDGLGAA